jgi:hypothetical protein
MLDAAKIDAIVDAVDKLSSRLDAMVDADAKVPSGRQRLEIKKTPMLPHDEAYLKRMIEEAKTKPEDRHQYTGPKYKA